MTIRYADGKTLEGIILSRDGNTMRVAVRDGYDAVVLTCLNGNWISDDCGPVEVEFEWQRYAGKKAVAESDCICPKELAARLIRVLVSGDEDDILLEQGLAVLESRKVMECAGKHSHTITFMR